MRRPWPLLLVLLLAAPSAGAEPDASEDAPAAEARPSEPSGEKDGEGPPAAPDQGGDSSEDAADDAAEADAERPLDEDGYPVDDDTIVEVTGLVYEFFVEDDGDEKQLGIEAPEGDYLVRGGAANALAAKRGSTVTVRGWTRTDESGDTWLWVEDFEASE
jgi:hypothetical protein